jgi:hypothetical protein
MITFLIHLYCGDYPLRFHQPGPGREAFKSISNDQVQA